VPRALLVAGHTGRHVGIIVLSQKPRIVATQVIYINKLMEVQESHG
jgi:hypothetical protein